MEAKINIVEILKHKPQGTKLYSSACGKCRLGEVDDKSFKISFYNSKFGFMNGGEGYLDKNGKLYDDGECVVFPSKEMRDWRKFDWKKGDVLVNSSGFKLFFDRWANDDYTRFFGKVNLLEDSFSYETEKYTLASKEETLDTFEREKPEFKDGDIVVTDAVPSLCYSKCIFILKGDLNTGESCANSYIFYNINNNDFCFDVLDTEIRDRNIHLATEEEKLILFDALAKKGKAWDAENKMVVDLKPKVELKPFDRVLCRDEVGQEWHIDLFESVLTDDSEYNYECMVNVWKICIPYKGNEHLLGTTNNVEG